MSKVAAATTTPPPPTWGASADQVRNGTSALQHGNKGSGVEQLQKNLASAGYAVKPTGVYDDETRNAVRSFQDDYALKGKGGVVDQQAFKTLEGAGKRDDRIKDILKDSKIDGQEAKQAVRLAMADANLRPGDRSEKNVKPSLVSLYTRNGMPVAEADAAARRTIELADKGGSAIQVKNEAQPKMDDAGKTALRTQTEKDAAGNADRTKPWTTADVKKDAPGFVRNMVQSDGDTKTENDRSSCHVQSMLAGSILKKPESAQELGEKLLSDKGKKEFPGVQKEPVLSAAQRMKDGKYSPADVSRVGTAMYDASQYKDPNKEGKTTGGMNNVRDLALQGKLQNIGWQPAESRVDAYGTEKRQATHATAYSNGTGYDPFNYPGSGGQATVTRGEASAKAHGEGMGKSTHFLPEQKRVLLERSEYDGKGGANFTTTYVDGKKLEPPLTARYTYDKSKEEWVRDPSAKVVSVATKIRVILAVTST